MIVYGASGHGKVVIGIINSMKDISVSHIVDDNKEITELLNFPVCHDIEGFPDEQVVLAIGDNQIRKKVAAKVQNKFCSPLIHKKALVSEIVEIGKGTVIMAGAIINPSVSIGAHCIINTSAVVEHDVDIEDYAHISPGAILTGNVKVGEGSQIGAGATVIPGVKIGKWCVIGAGAVVINDIPDYSVAVGNPAKIIKFNKLKDE